MRRFVHEWDPEDHQTNTLGEVHPPADVNIEMVVDEEGFYLSANHEGFRWLARLFAEIADSDLELGWHTHRDRNMRVSDQPPEFTLGLGSSDDEPHN